MIDDTKHLPDGTKVSHTGLASQIDNILEHRIVREHAVQWSHNLRFLTFDDVISHHDGTTQETSEENEDEIEELPNRTLHIEGQCQRCELQVPVPSGHMCESHIPFSRDDGVRERSLRKYDNPCVHVCEHTCDSCKHVPLFPNHGTVSTFQIRRLDPGAWAHCRHFIAISYCWAAQSIEDTIVPHYKVVEEDGTVRDMRASNSTIDRVVDFARQNGFRMIWIDQVSNSLRCNGNETLIGA